MGMPVDVSVRLCLSGPPAVLIPLLCTAIGKWTESNIGSMMDRHAVQHSSSTSMEKSRNTRCGAKAMH